ncbi:hypothetical protein [Candidatus Uabimicrobium sp. HlEnr_7]|uniref:hypothetical protein n=1 Tax=Candidatus Uabimicrobium helgolandensis TaxID=3095367 RepID=UPI003556139B
MKICKTIVWITTLFCIIGCQNTTKNSIQDTSPSSSSSSSDEVVEINEEDRMNEIIKTEEINESQPSINIDFNEKQVYAGQKANLSVNLFNDSEKYNTTINDFVYSATYGKFDKSVYTAPLKIGLDTITIKHTPSNIEKAINVKVVATPKLEVDINSTLSCSDIVKLSPKVYIGDIAQDYPLSTFVYAAKHGLFTRSEYYCPDKEIDDVITITYPALQLKKQIKVAIRAKPVLTLDKIPESIEKDGSFVIKAFFKKAQNKEDISSGDLSFSCSIGRFDQAKYVATKIGNAKITVTHNATGQKITKKVSIKESLKLEVEVPKRKLENFSTMEINASLIQSKKVIDDNRENFEFTARLGSFQQNIYKAPSVDQSGGEVIDIVTVRHKKQNLSEEIKVKVVYSQFLTVRTSRFAMPVPSNWHVKNKDMGFLATSYEGKIQIDRGSEIKALALSGFGFLDPQTVMVLFQQQGGIGRNMEKVGEDQINIADQNVTRVLFESSGQTLRKSWWIIFKYKRIMYLLTLSGEEEFFNGENSPASKLLREFKLLPLDSRNPSLEMSSEFKNIDEPFFELSVPKSWKSDNIFDVFFASSSVAHEGEKIGLFVFAHRSREIQSMDLSLILLLFRQEIVKDPTMIASEEEEIEIQGIPAKMVEFSGGKDSTDRMWIIAIKYNFTGYVVVVNGPDQIWKANPKFAEKIKSSFKPK